MKKIYLLIIVALSTHANADVIIGAGISKFNVLDIKVPLIDIAYEHSLSHSHLISTGLIYSSGGQASFKSTDQVSQTNDAQFEYKSYHSIYAKYQYNLTDNVGFFLRPEYYSYDITTSLPDVSVISTPRDGFSLGLGLNYTINDKFIFEITNINEEGSETIALFGKYKFQKINNP